jgi:hypothetical protein
VGSHHRQLWVNWDNGSNLNLINSVDTWVIIGYDDDLLRVDLRANLRAKLRLSCGIFGF